MSDARVGAIARGVEATSDSASRRRIDRESAKYRRRAAGPPVRHANIRKDAAVSQWPACEHASARVFRAGTQLAPAAK